MKLPSLLQLQSEIDELNRQMSDPALLKQGQKMKAMAKELEQKQQLAEAVKRYEAVTAELNETESMLASEDEELRTLAQEDKNRLVEEQKTATVAIEELLVPRNPLDERDIILEIRAGGGGEEASLFAQELFRAYSRYAEANGSSV